MLTIDKNCAATHVKRKLTFHSEPLVTTIRHLRICHCILKLAEVKENWCGMMYESEITSLVGVKSTTLESYLEELKLEWD